MPRVGALAAGHRLDEFPPWPPPVVQANGSGKAKRCDVGWQRPRCRLAVEPGCVLAACGRLGHCVAATQTIEPLAILVDWG